MEFDLYTIVVLMIAFWWSGFVRAGIGFGGAGLMYPVALLAVDSILFLVPIICVQLLIFSTATLIKDHHLIDWKTLGKLFATLFPTFMIGVFGLITLPADLVLYTVYAVIIYYSLSYIFNINTARLGKWLDYPVLLAGGYVSGLSLSGAPLIAAVAIKKLEKRRVRASLFVLWSVLVVMKLGTLYIYDVDLQLRHQLWLLPCALVGHLMGLRVHDRLMLVEGPAFYRWLGAGLLAVCLASITRHLLA
jgi:uncharacterized protein